ncbi:hypothetical protein ACLMPM_24335 [Yersinia enterocolitica]|uniref:hypothetical protein n=2 Tax=Yersinia enterocolitica TaxID=630 RepID=UPI00398D2DE6
MDNPMNDKNSRLSVLKPLLRVGQRVEMSLKWLFVSTAGRALRASLGTRFTRSQVTPRSLAFSTNVKYATPSSAHFVIESGRQSLKEKCNSSEYCKAYLDEKVKIEVEETLSRLDCEPHFQRLTGYRPKASPLRLG